MFRSALVAIKPSLSHQYLLDFAAQTAARQQWALTTCTIIDPERLAPAEPVPVGAGAIKAELDLKRQQAAREQAQQVEARCREVCVASGVACSMLHLEGDTVQHLADVVEAHDVLLVGHTLGADTSEESLLHSIIKNSCRPAIVVPRERPRGENVLVAYDGSFQASRALASLAYSGIATGREVHVVACDADEVHGNQVAGSACEFLARHGLRAIPHTECHTGGVVPTMLAKAEQYGAGLLVMGSFGKGAWREFFFGSITRQILHEVPIPVLLDH